LSRLWDEPAYYRSMSDAALAFAARPEFAPDAITDQFLAHLTRRLTAAGARSLAPA
jgi:hypothetical protein